MNKGYERAKKNIMEALEEIVRVKASSEEYLSALIYIGDGVQSWFEASMEAARDDIRRQDREPTE